MLYIIHGTESLTEEEVIESSYPADVLRLKRALEKYFREEPDGIGAFLELLRQKRSERKKVKGVLSEIAEISLFLPARVLVYLAAEINGPAIWGACKGETFDPENWKYAEKGFQFWEVWKEIYEGVYHDEKMKVYASPELQAKRQKAIHRLVEAIRTVDFLQPGEDWLYGEPEEVRKLPEYVFTDDDRLYWWDGTDEVQISVETDKWLKELAGRHKEFMKKETGEETDGMDFLMKLTGLLEDASEYYRRVYACMDLLPYKAVNDKETNPPREEKITPISLTS